MKLKKQIIYLVLVFCAMSGSKLTSQISLKNCQVELPTEKIKLSIDQDVYFAGDQIGFVAYVITEGIVSSPLSKVLYLEVYDDLQKGFTQEKFEIIDGKVIGHLVLSASMSTGYYFVRAYTNYSKNFGLSSMGHKIIKFVNPFVPGREVAEENFFNDMGSPEFQDNLHCELLNGSVYQNRRKVALEFQHLPASLKNVSISVRHNLLSASSDDRFEKLKLNNEWVENSSIGIGQSHLNYLPEYRGLHISGNIQSSENSDTPIDETCILSLLSDPPQVHVSQTDKDGNFLFVLKELEGKKKIRIGLNGFGKDGYNIRVDRDFDYAFPEVHNVAVKYDSVQHTQYETIFTYQQLERAQIEHQAPKDGMFNLGSFDLVRSTDDYIKLKDLREIFLEIIPNVIVGSKDGRNTITVFNKAKQEYHNDPLVLLDNVPVANYEGLLDLKSKHIADISVNYSRFHLGEKMIGGIVSIRTIKNDFGGFPIPTPTAYFDYNFGATKSWTKDDATVDYSKGNATRSPDLRTTLVWAPDVAIDHSSNTFEFYTSDVKGKYEIKVEGYDDNGKYFFTTEHFSVK